MVGDCMQDTEVWNGISVDGMDKLMTDILDYADKCNKTLNQISDLVEDTSTYFICESGDKFRDQFSMLKVGNATINKNILSYNEDLMNVKRDYQNRSEQGTEILNAGENDVISRL